MPDMLGKDDCFVPEAVEDIWTDVWDVRVGESLYLADDGVTNNRIGGGGFGEAFSVAGWLGDGLPSFPTRADGDRCMRESHCCLKILPMVSATEPEDQYARRIQLEYQILLDANGANGRVPRPLGYGKMRIGEHVNRAIVMEYLPNGAGTYFLNDRTMANDRLQCNPGSVTPLQAATFAYQMCLALKDLHTCQGQSGITHRDLQPGNVAVRLANGRAYPALDNLAGSVGRVYMIDLGNSTPARRMVTPGFGGDHAPRAATFQYGAPEVFDMYEDGHEGSLWRFRNEPTADIWSLGALIYYYFTGMHPSLFDQSKEAPREAGTIPKERGLSIPQAKLDEHRGEPALKLIDDIVRRCTTFDPRTRRHVAALDNLIYELEQVLGIISEKTPQIKTLVHTGNDPEHKQETEPEPEDEPETERILEPEPEPVMRREAAGSLSFLVPDALKLESTVGNRRSYRMADDTGRTFRFVTSWEKGVLASCDEAAYANALAERLDELFLHSGKVKGPDALGMLSIAGATVKPGRGTDPAYCVIELTVPQKDAESFVMRMHLYFSEQDAVLLGLGCRCPQEEDYDVKFLLEDQMARLVETFVWA